MNKIQNNYLKRKRIIDLLKESIKSKVTYIFAPIASGKTIAVKQLEQAISCNFIWVDCNTSDEIIIKNEKHKYIVLENFSELNKKNENFILDFILKNHNKFIILSRKPIDIKLKILYYLGDLSEITLEDLNFNISEINDFFQSKNIQISDFELEQLYLDTHGNSFAINMLSTYLKNGHYDTQKYIVSNELLQYMELELFNNIEKDILNFMQKIAVINIITVKTVNYILNIENAEEMLNKVEEIGGLIYKSKSEEYEFFYMIKKYFQHKTLSKSESEKIKNIYLRAAKYYEDIEKNEIHSGEYYILAKKYDIGAKVLAKQHIQHLGIINYTELEKCILQIPTEIIEKYPELCIALAHTNRLTENRSQSIYWYEKFEEIKENFRDDVEKYERLKQMGLYYQICMPTTNDIKLIKYFQLLHKSVKGNTILNTITFTGNLPSILSGGKDLSNWSKHSKILYILLNSLIEVIFKENQTGSGDFCYAEFLYETNRLEESIKYICKGMSVCQNVDLLFVAYSILDKINLAKNENSLIIENFRETIEDKKAWYLQKNYEARIIEKYILFGNTKKIQNWIYDNKTNVIQKFNLLERYVYFTLVRAFIATEKYLDALIVLERLYEFIKKYNRTIYEIEYDILQSICLYRTSEEKRAFEYIDHAILIAQKFNYVRLFADEGLVVNEILKKYANERKNKSIINSEFYNKILQETKKYGELYPNKYKKILNNAKSILTNKEIEILELMKKGKTNKEIAEEQSVSLATVKTHINHIYSKLGTKNRIQTINKMKKE